MNSHSNDISNHADNFSCPVSNKVCHNSNSDHTQTYMTPPKHSDYQIYETCDYLQINTFPDKPKSHAHSQESSSSHCFRNMQILVTSFSW